MNTHMNTFAFLYMPLPTKLLLFAFSSTPYLPCLPPFTLPSQKTCVTYFLFVYVAFASFMPQLLRAKRRAAYSCLPATTRCALLFSFSAVAGRARGAARRAQGGLGLDRSERRATPAARAWRQRRALRAARRARMRYLLRILKRGALRRRGSVASLPAASLTHAFAAYALPCLHSGRFPFATPATYYSHHGAQTRRAFTFVGNSHLASGLLLLQLFHASPACTTTTPLPFALSLHLFAFGKLFQDSRIIPGWDSRMDFFLPSLLELPIPPFLGQFRHFACFVLKFFCVCWHAWW